MVFSFSLKILELDGHLYVCMCVFLVTITKVSIKKHPSINLATRYKGEKIVIAIKGLNNET